MRLPAGIFRSASSGSVCRFAARNKSVLKLSNGQRSMILLCAGIMIIGLSACAGFDASVLDSAKCLQKGQISTGIVYGMGIDAPGWLEIDPQNIFDSDSAGLVQALEVKYGLQDDLDATVRLSAHHSGAAGKLLLKKQLHQEDQFTTAVVFGGGYLGGQEDYWRESSDYWQDYRFKLLSAEVQLLATKDFPKNIFLTLAARGNYHQYEWESRGLETTREQFHHAGARINLGRTYGGFTMIFELGVEAPLSAGDIDQVYPWGGYKMAWEWNSKKKK